MGDLPHKPGTAALAALGAIQAGARYIKAGLHGTRDYGQALEVMSAVARTCREADAALLPVAAGYADYRRFGGLDPLTIVRVARDSGAALVMLDTAVKDGASLFDALSEAEIAAFLVAARAAGLATALAGSLRAGHLGALGRLGVDVVGIRGAVCRHGDRLTQDRRRAGEGFRRSGPDACAAPDKLAASAMNLSRRATDKPARAAIVPPARQRNFHQGPHPI